MRTEHLEFLVEIAKTNSISLAGKNLHISHQGISHAINRLEDELGVKLLTRTNNGVYLTELGREFVDLTIRFLDELEKTKQRATARRQKCINDLGGTISVTYAPLFNINVLPKAVASFNKEYPRVKISMRELESSEILKIIAAGEADLGLVALLNKNKNILLAEPEVKGAVKFQRLFDNSVCAVVGKSSPLALKKSLSISEVVKHPLIAYLHPKKNTIINYIVSHPDLYGEPSVIIDSESLENTRSAVAEGAAAGIFPELWLKYYLDDDNVISKPISDKINYVCGWVKNSKRELSAALEAFIDILKTYCDT